MNNANETRAEFNHLIAVAKNTGCAIVIIAHMNKMRDTNPLYRTNGSIDIAGAARSILAITRTPNKEVPAERYMVQVKSNLAPTGSAILFEVAEKGVDFISEMEMTAEEAFQSLAPKMGRPNEKELKAKEFLLKCLKTEKCFLRIAKKDLKPQGSRNRPLKRQRRKQELSPENEAFCGTGLCRWAIYRENKCRLSDGRTVCFYDGGIKRRSRGNSLAHDIFADEV